LFFGGDPAAWLPVTDGPWLSISLHSFWHELGSRDCHVKQ
jgi:hypothetical protein